MNDAFISYRRLDGQVFARRLRRRLLDYRFPPSLRDRFAERLRIYLDTLYERAASDFFDKTIEPALKDSKHLIVVQTPGALRPRKDGQKNWVVREIETFRGLPEPQKTSISVALARGSVDDPLPADLHETLPNIERVDIRRLGPFGFGAHDEVLSFIATLYNVPAELMPELRREEAKRRATLAWTIVTGALLIIVILGLSLWQALTARAAALSAQRATQHELATAHLRAAVAAQQPAVALAHAARAVRADPEYRSARMLLLDLLINREWPLPLVEVAHPGTVVEVVFSPDDRRFVTRNEREVRVWRSSDGAPLTPPFGLNAYIYEMSFTPDWSTVYLATTDGWRAWDVASGKALPIGSGLQMTLTARTIGPNSLLVETVTGTSSICDAKGQGCVSSAPLLGSATCGGRALIERGGHPVLVELGSGQPVGRPWPIKDVRLVVFSGDCRWLATTISTPQGIQIWRGDGTPAGNIPHKSKVTSIEFSPDDAKVAATDDDGHVMLWSVSELKQLADVPHGGSETMAHFAYDGTKFVSGSAGGARLFDSSSGEELLIPAEHTERVTSVALSHDGTKLLTGGVDGIARVWDIRHGGARELELAVPGGEPVRFSSDSRRIAVCAETTTAVFDAARGTPAATPWSHPYARISAVDRDLDHCLLVDNEGQASVHDAASGRLIGAAVPHPKTVVAAALDDDGAYAATASIDGARSWPVASPASRRRLHGAENDEAWGVAFTGRGKEVVAGFNKHFAVAGRDLVSFRDAPAPDGATEIAPSEDGESILLGTMSARLYSARTGKPLGPPLLRGRAHNVEHATLSADGTIAATSSEKSVLLWNARTGVLITDPLQHDRKVVVLAFNAGGDRLLTGAEDGIRIWDVATGLQLVHHPTSSSAFSTYALAPDESRTVASDGYRTAVFDLPIGSTQDAVLLADVAEAVSGLRINASGAVESMQRRAGILGRASAATAKVTAPADSSAALIRWLLANRTTRPYSPFRGVADVHSGATPPRPIGCW